ncbi:MAG: 2-phospho-L-lactate transferase [Gammaproteobacteria bacterium]|nr:2-phospho-L-lactate transferase [Gammaproteobacteria bacterium]NIR84372.1 2-phospho-L-lactate transferase [Gammaproteobacteria bacterium]NIR90853.1 2-phospho-L-lactate transferase [Gammaproteobacteria bacterium]NIU07039.1 2-phospho-L-lactate transferase [Gammaproteobacteria bacterium]NIV76168.1 2-phospho-L-lactate transferase [Gammaproteobacteria bacterium]
MLALSGGVGGAKLALGLSRILPPDRLTVIANTGDDFEHLGLHIAPDLDTLMYTLAGLDNPDTGWGRRDETWHCMAALETLGGETWFRLGDADLATHLERTRRLRGGASLTAVTARLCERLGLSARLAPMSDDPVRTVVHTTEGALPFQEYFVHRRCVPRVIGFAYAGADAARASPILTAALADPDLRAVVLCPSNPFLSIDPILALPGIRTGLAACRAPVVAVSPLCGGRAFKGPTAKILRELGLPANAATIAQHYEGLLDVLVLDEADAREADDLGVPGALAPTRMVTLADRESLAQAVLSIADAQRRTAQTAAPRSARVYATDVTGEHDP